MNESIICTTLNFNHLSLFAYGIVLVNIDTLSGYHIFSSYSTASNLITSKIAFHAFGERMQVLVPLTSFCILNLAVNLA